jgi:hypothetical protein
MPKFEAGDKAQALDNRFVFDVLEVGVCPDADRDFCPSQEIVRAVNPLTGEDDWFHADEFEKVNA